MKKFLSFSTATILGGYSIFAADLRISDLPTTTVVLPSNTVPVVLHPGVAGGLFQANWSNILSSLITFQNWPPTLQFNPTQFNTNNNRGNIKGGAIVTNLIEYMGVNGDHGFVTWTNTINDGRPALVDSNRSPIISLRHTNDPLAPAILHSKIYYGGGTEAGAPFSVPGHYWEDHHFILPDLVNDVVVDPNYVGLTINFDDQYAWSFRQYRFKIIDAGGFGPLGVSGEYNVISNDMFLTRMSFGDTNWHETIFAKGLRIDTPYIPASSILMLDAFKNLTNLIIGANLSLVGNTLSASGGGGGGGQFNNNQFSATTSTNIKDSALFTNPIAVTSLILSNAPGDGSGRLRLYQTNGIRYTEITIPDNYFATNKIVLSIASNTVTAGQALVVHSSSIAAGVNTILLTNSSVTASPAGTDGSIQFNQQNLVLAGTNVFIVDRTNNILKLTGVNPSIEVVDTGTGATNIFNALTIGSKTATPISLASSNTPRWQLEAGGNLVPLSDSVNSLGSPTAHTKSNFTGVLDTTNLYQHGFKVIDAQLPTLANATNFIFDGSKGDYYVWGVSNTVSTTPLNFVITNLQQSMRIHTWVTNGQSVIVQVGNAAGGQTIPASWYVDQAITPVDTNGWSTIDIWKAGSLGTNIYVRTRTYTLSFSGGLVGTTNYVTGNIDLNGAGSGGGTGGTNFDSLVITNQAIYIPLELNGSNAVTPTATYNWDMRQNTFRPITNFVNTNVVFTLSNVVRGVSGIATFIGSPNALSNTVTVAAVSGVNIKWMNWATNGTTDFLIRPNYSYVLQLFADRTTNVNAWVSTDDPFNALNVYQFGSSNAGIYNLVVTNLQVGAGRGGSNATVGGTMYVSTLQETNLGVTTFTNITPYTVPGNTLTNNGDNLIIEWAGRLNAGTNTINFGYTGGATNLLAASITNGPGLCNYSARLNITRTSANAVHVDGVFNVPPSMASFGFTNINRELSTDTGTNAQIVLNCAQSGGTRPGSLTNTFFKVRYEPTSR